MNNNRFTIQDFYDIYTDDAICLEEIFQNRYGRLKVCPRCSTKAKFYRIKKRPTYCCQNCGYTLSPLANTIFHKSSTSLRTWFYVMFLFANAKNGVSAKEVQRQTGVTYKTAWKICHQVRKLFKQYTNTLEGIVEVDETYVKVRGKNKRGFKTPAPVMGMVERNGYIRAVAVDNTRSHTLGYEIRNSVQLGTVVMTDEYASYRNLKYNGYKHKTVNHSKYQYVRGKVHTNTIEGFWSQLKRSLRGTYHAVSARHLQSYVDEFAFRYNRRFSSSSLFPLLVATASTLVLKNP